MVFQNLLFVFSLFEKLGEGHPLGNVNIFHSNLKYQLRFRDYLEKGGKVHGALWLDERNPNAMQICFKVAESVDLSRQFHLSLLRQVCCSLVPGIDSVQLSEWAPYSQSSAQCMPVSASAFVILYCFTFWDGSSCISPNSTHFYNLSFQSLH